MMKNDDNYEQFAMSVRDALSLMLITCATTIGIVGIILSIAIN
jgi:hypothetical protein